MMLSDSGLCARACWTSVNLEFHTLSCHSESVSKPQFTVNFLNFMNSWWTWWKVLLPISPNQMMLPDSGLHARTHWTLVNLNFTYHPVTMNKSQNLNLLWTSSTSWILGGSGERCYFTFYLNRMMLLDSRLCARTHWTSINLNFTYHPVTMNQSQNLNLL